MLRLVAVALVALAAAVHAQNNVTSLFGTWTSGSGAVVTGAGFADPMNNDHPFIYPANTGIAYSFTDDGFFETAQYRFKANASHPACPTAVIFWQHGTYQLHPNGSLTMSPAPFADDGRLQTQNPCTPTTSILTYYNEWEMWDKWSIEIDTSHSAYSIHAQNYNGKIPRWVLRLSERL
ncbi:Reversal of tor2 lethality [Rhodotorula sphaerocarpa]